VILYIHGFGSSALSAKAQKLQTLPFSEPFLAPSLSTIPHLAMQTLEDIVQLYIHSCDTELSSLKLMGSSLGGYYALYLSQKYNLKAVLINPSIHPYDTLSEFSTMTSYYDGSSFEWSKEHIESLHQYETKNITSTHNILLLAQKGDETLDYTVALKKLKGCQHNIEEGGSHGFEHIEKHFKSIEHFFTM